MPMCTKCQVSKLDGVFGCKPITSALVVFEGFLWASEGLLVKSTSLIWSLRVSFLYYQFRAGDYDDYDKSNESL